MSSAADMVLVKTYINKDRKNIQIEELRKREDYGEERRKIRYMLLKRDEEAAEAYEREHMHGYCPHCHCLIPMNGHCDCQD